jgi:general secretion pathway protein F
MPIFRYSAYRAGGASVAGTIEAESLRDAQQRLKSDGLFPREISSADESAGRRRGLRNRVPLQELALVTRRLATLLTSSVPVYEAVGALQDQERPGAMKSLLGRIRERLKEGTSLAQALAAEPQAFSESYVAMVGTGEASGSLDSILERLADFLESQAATRSRIVTALAYPLLMLLVGSGVMLFLLSFVVPKIVIVFEQNRAALPLITVALMAVSRFMQQWWWALLGCGCALLIAYDRSRHRPAFRAWSDRIVLRLPLAGHLIRNLLLARFSRVLGLLLASGVPMIRSLEIAAEVVANRTFRTALEQVREELIEGGRLSASLARSALFPPLLLHMIAVGEKGGNLEQMLDRSGSAFEKEFDAAVTRSMALLEPLLVLGMGLGVGIVVIAVLLPIFQLNQLIR